MMALLQHPLMLPIVIPIIAGLVLRAIPRLPGQICALFAVVVSMLTLIVSWPLLNAAPSVFEPLSWLLLKNDLVSRFIIFAIAMFGVLIALYSVSFMKGHSRIGEYYAYLLISVGISIGAVLANDLILLLVFWGFLGLLLYLMVGISGPNASAAAKKSFVIIGGSDCLLILSIAILWTIRGSTRMDLYRLDLESGLNYIAFFGVLIAGMAKAGAMPFHSWVPDVAEKSVPPVSAFLPASLDKLLGIYLIIRCVTTFFIPDHGVNTLIMLCGAVTIIGAVLLALIQHDMKRLLGFHAVSQVGYMLLGIGTGSVIGIAGGLFHMINHTMYKSTLFLCAGAVEQRAKTTDIDKLGGLARVMPITFIACLIASLSISGVPPFNGFASKWMIYQGVIETGNIGGKLWIIWIAAAMLGSALTMASFVKILHAVFLCKPAPSLKIGTIKEVSLFMSAPMIILSTLCIATGIGYSFVVTRWILPAVAPQAVFPGTWGSGIGTLLILVSLAVGALSYLLGTVRKARIVPTYVGGENLSTTYLAGEAAGPARNIEVTGADFYQTIKTMPVLRLFYRGEDNKLYDIFDLGRRVQSYVAALLQKAHNGILPVYLAWILVGFIIVIGFIFSVEIW